MPGATHPRLRVIADQQFGNGSPATWYLMLFLTLPADDGTGGVEPTIGVGGYARVAAANNTTTFPAATTVSNKTTKSNGVKLTFPNPTTNWGKSVGYGWTDVSTGGVPQFVNPYDGDAQLTVVAGLSPVEFDIGQLIMGFGGGTG